MSTPNEIPMTESNDATERRTLEAFRLFASAKELEDPLRHEKADVSLAHYQTAHNSLEDLRPPEYLGRPEISMKVVRESFDNQPMPMYFVLEEFQTDPARINAQTIQATVEGLTLFSDLLQAGGLTSQIAAARLRDLDDDLQDLEFDMGELNLEDLGDNALLREQSRQHAEMLNSKAEYTSFQEDSSQMQPNGLLHYLADLQASVSSICQNGSAILELLAKEDYAPDMLETISSDHQQTSAFNLEDAAEHVRLYLQSLRPRAPRGSGSLPLLSPSWSAGRSTPGFSSPSHWSGSGVSHNPSGPPSPMVNDFRTPHTISRSASWGSRIGTARSRSRTGAGTPAGYRSRLSLSSIPAALASELAEDEDQE